MMRKLTFSRKYLGIPYAVFLAIFIILPIFLVVWYAFTDANGKFTLANFANFFTPTVLTASLYSLFIATLTTLLCLLIAYPVAYILARSKSNKSAILVLLFVLPMWMNFLLRTLATREIFLAMNEIFGANTVVLGMGTTLFGMVYNFLPFMVLPLYTTMLKMDQSLIEAAQDLGATPVQVFVHTVIPLSKPGIISGAMMVFMPTISTFVISEMLSGGRIYLLGNLINLNFTAGHNWNLGSAISLVILILIGISMFLTRGQDVENTRGGLW